MNQPPFDPSSRLAERGLLREALERQRQRVRRLALMVVVLAVMNFALVLLLLRCGQ